MPLKSLSEQIYEQILWDIRTGKLEAGEKLSDAELAEQFGASRTPVREALFKLVEDDVLISKKNQGFFIRSVSAEEMEKKAEIVACLDARAAKLSLPYLKEEHFLTMEDYIRRSDLAIAQKDYKFYYECQGLFHKVYFDLCPNEYLIDTIRDVQKSLIRDIPLSDDEEFLYRVLAMFNNDHRKILEAFRNKDYELLHETVMRHRYRPGCDPEHLLH